MPLAVKDLRPLRGAFGVLDHEPLARHRQNGGAGRSLPQPAAAQPSTANVETGIIQARFRATDVPEVTWAASRAAASDSAYRALSWGFFGATEASGFLLSSRSQVRVLPGAPAKTAISKIENCPTVATSCSNGLSSRPVAPRAAAALPVGAHLTGRRTRDRSLHGS